MKYIIMLANGIAITSTMFCMGYLYRFQWRLLTYGRPVLSILIIGITTLITGLQFAVPEILPVLTRNKEALLSGEWWRMITPLFVQPYGLGQCLFNGMFMIVFLPLAEKLYGQRMLLLYFIPGIVGQFFNYFWGRDGGGSSTAIFGVMGSLLIYVIRHRKELPPPYFPLATSGIIAAVVLFFFKDGHAPGLLSGALLASLMPDAKSITKSTVAN